MRSATSSVQVTISTVPIAALGACATANVHVPAGWPPAPPEPTTPPEPTAPPEPALPDAPPVLPDAPPAPTTGAPPAPASGAPPAPAAGAPPMLDPPLPTPEAPLPPPFAPAIPASTPASDLAPPLEHAAARSPRLATISARPRFRPRFAIGASDDVTGAENRLTDGSAERLRPHGVDGEATAVVAVHRRRLAVETVRHPH